MDYSRRDLGKLALALPAAALLGRSESLFAEFLQAAKPNSKFRGVQIGTITYSYRSMPDQSAEAILRYIVDSGISAVELMGGPVDQWARAKTGFQPSGGGRGGGGRAGAAPAAGAPGAGAPAAGAPGAAPAGGGGGRAGGRGAPDPATLTASWNGVPCAPGVGPGGREAAPPPPPAPVAPAGAAAAAGQVAAAAGGGGRGGRGEQTPEQIAAAEETRKWRQSLSMDVFKDLRKLYNDAGVTIYAVKNLSVGGSNEDLDFQFTVAKTLGADHITAELPSGPEAAANLKRVGEMAVKHKMFAAYHTHAQGSMTAFDEAFAISKGNKANVDLGHFVAGGNKGGTPLDFLNKFHDRIGSFHLKDRTLPKNCSLNLAWGTGETPIKEILQLVAKNKWPIPASIELEYAVPEGSDAVKEVRKCVEYCRAALA